MHSSIFNSGRDALVLALKNKKLAPKTLHSLALSGAPWIQSQAIDVLFKHSTA